MIDLRREPDELLLRVLLATDAPVAVIVRNNHADIVDERSQRALLDLVAAMDDRALPPEHARFVHRDRDRDADRIRQRRCIGSPMFRVIGWRKKT